MTLLRLLLTFTIAFSLTACKKKRPSQKPAQTITATNSDIKPDSTTPPSIPGDAIKPEMENTPDVKIPEQSPTQPNDRQPDSESSPNEDRSPEYEQPSKPDHDEDDCVEPTVPAEPPYQGGMCVGVGAYKELPGIEGWCETNCKAGFCPETHCSCAN